MAAQCFREMNFEDRGANSFFFFCFLRAAIKDLREPLSSVRECHHQKVNSRRKFTDLTKKFH